MLRGCPQREATLANEIGQTTRTALDIFRGYPFTLALIVMNLALLAMLYWSGANAEREREKALDLLYQNRKEVAELLFKCQPPRPQ